MSPAVQSRNDTAIGGEGNQPGMRGSLVLRPIDSKPFIWTATRMQ